MKRQSILSTNFMAVIALGIIMSLSSCKKEQTPDDIKHLEEFHIINFAEQEKDLKENQLKLYVDYSTCNMLGQNSSFFQEIAASLVTKTTEYYSIKGDAIEQEDIGVNGGVYTLLRNINEVNYADLSKAITLMSNSDCESVLITDGEYYTPSIAKGHDNDPYLAEAFKKWILRGYDVHLISEPYMEPNGGKLYNKKRFYILFTDDRMPNNIYERIRRTVSFTNFPDVDEFHLSASHPRMKGNGVNSSVQNSILESKSKGYGVFEIQDWDGCDWKTIEDEIVNAIDEKTGDVLENGATVIEMGVDKNSFGCYRISGLKLNVYNINQYYNEFYIARENGEKLGRQEYNLESVQLENFMLIDNKEFEKHSKIDIHFNQPWFDPNVLLGKPYNYLKLDIVIDDVKSIFDQHEEKFEFESISKDGEKNVSVASSIKQCLADDKVLKKMIGQVIYTIYVKSEKK
jgi:hypothetical protein